MKSMSPKFSHLFVVPLSTFPKNSSESVCLQVILQTITYTTAGEDKSCLAEVNTR